MIRKYHFLRVIGANYISDKLTSLVKTTTIEQFWLKKCTEPTRWPAHSRLCRVLQCRNEKIKLFSRTVENLKLPRILADVLAWVFGHSWFHLHSFSRTFFSSSCEKSAPVYVKREFLKKRRITWSLDKSEPWNQFKTCSFWDSKLQNV